MSSSKAGRLLLHLNWLLSLSAWQGKAWVILRKLPKNPIATHHLTKFTCFPEIILLSKCVCSHTYRWLSIGTLSFKATCTPELNIHQTYSSDQWTVTIASFWHLNLSPWFQWKNLQCFNVQITTALILVFQTAHVIARSCLSDQHFHRAFTKAMVSLRDLFLSFVVIPVRSLLI